MELDWNLLEREIRSAAVRIAREVVSDHPGQTFYGLALEVTATAPDAADVAADEPLRLPVLGLNSEQALDRDLSDEERQLKAYDQELAADAEDGALPGLPEDEGGDGEDDDDSDGADNADDVVDTAIDDMGDEDSDTSGELVDEAADLRSDGTRPAGSEASGETGILAGDEVVLEALDAPVEEGGGFYSRRWDASSWHWCSMDLFDEDHVEAWNERLNEAAAEHGWEDTVKQYYRTLIAAVIGVRQELDRKRLHLVAFVSDEDHAEKLLQKCLTEEQLQEHFPDLVEFDAEAVG
ncbi:hypothetical protein [Zhihengliuella salsuginis]|uniref:DUF4303 domain-containing protein n=1 Tax=Zhihengliuella salsuginis TaxID=578222 RepID=A0ABQ3GLR3_9MICC|nr:hypothetical protein [Zhihengliuella salsuginis]GHD09265.1 hypothetical protein GCM10008096_21750 [Zhihengliuella salsuginis]